MNDNLPWEPVWQLAGWTMIHYLWIGTLVALALAMVRLALRHVPPSWRYAVTLVGFVVLAAMPVAIAAWIARDIDWHTAGLSPPDAIVRFDAIASIDVPPAVPEMPTAKPQAAAVIDLAETPLDIPPPQATRELEQASPAAAGYAVAPAAEVDPFVKLANAVPDFLPWLWIVGTPLTFLLLATGLIGSERLRRRAQVLTDGPVYDVAQRLRAALRLSRQVTVAVTDRVLQPVLVGIVRP